MALNSILMYNGKLLRSTAGSTPSRPWSGTRRPLVHHQTAPDSVFCDGWRELPDGRLVIGGYGGLTTGNLGLVDTNIFDPATNTWTRAADMHHPRWYPALTELADGRFVASAATPPTPHIGPTPPRCTTRRTDTWTRSPACRPPRSTRTSTRSPTCCPTATSSPSARGGQVLRAQRQQQDVDPGGRLQRRRNGSSVMYLPGKILYTGGAADSSEHAGQHDHGGDRPDRGDAVLAPDRADGPRPDLPHADHAGRRHVLAVGGEPTTEQPGTPRSPAACCRPRSGTRRPRPGLPRRRRHHPRIPLDRGADARRDRAGRRRRPPQPRVAAQSAAGLLAVVPVQGPSPDDHLAPGPAATARASTSPPPTPHRSAPSTSCRSDPTRTRATWTSTSCRSASPRAATR